MGWVTVQGERLYLGRAAREQLASVEAGPVTVDTFWPTVTRATAKLYLQGMSRDGLLQWSEAADGRREYTLTALGREALRVLRELEEGPGPHAPALLDEVARLRAGVEQLRALLRAIDQNLLPAGAAYQVEAAAELAEELLGRQEERVCAGHK